MRASIVRILLSCLAAAVIVFRATSLTPDLETRLSIPARMAAAVAPVRAVSADAAIFLGETRSARRLVENCFTSSLETARRRTPAQTDLVAAALRREWEVVSKMISAGTAVDAADDSGVTPLMAAAMQGELSILHTLLEHKARVDAIDVAGRSALHYAITAGKQDAVALLLPLALNFADASQAGRDLLALAFETGNMAIFQTILEKLPPASEWSPITRRALEAALNSGAKEQVRLLLSKHLSAPSPEGRSVPLIAYAIAKDDAALFNTLLACGTDPNTTLPKICDSDFVSLLKSKFLRLYVEEETGVNLAMLAAGLGRTAFVHALLEAGADRNRMTPREKMLPLYFAASIGNWQCMQMLLGGGPTPDQLHVEISLAKQNVAVIKDGETIFNTQCSTGRDDHKTPAGHYVITDKDRDHRSTIYKVAMPYFMRLNCRDFGMHEGVVPRYPASHGCIRLPSSAARKLFAEIPVGTVVMIN